jgi:plastocyanin
MSRRLLVVVAAAALAASAFLVATAGAKKTKAPSSSATLVARSGTKVVINKYIADTSRFTPGTVTIKSGGTLTLKSVGGVPHTFSLVKASQLPRTAKAVNDCLPKGVCGELAKAHEADPSSDAPPKKILVDTGATGFDQAGDSVFFQGTTKVKITAKAGTTLRFLCAIHPWMQGKLVVR